MENKDKSNLVHLDDIKSQLTQKQIMELEHVIYIANESDQPQFAFNDLSLKIVVWPNGLLMLLKMGEE